jgi:hypothetical protein
MLEKTSEKLSEKRKAYFVLMQGVREYRYCERKKDKDVEEDAEPSYADWVSFDVKVSICPVKICLTYTDPDKGKKPAERGNDERYDGFQRKEIGKSHFLNQKQNQNGKKPPHYSKSINVAHPGSTEKNKLKS